MKKGEEIPASGLTGKLGHAWGNHAQSPQEPEPDVQAPVRELLGVMTAEKVGRGVFLTTSTFTKDALEFAAPNRIQLLDGPGFVRKICDLPEQAQADLLRFAFAGDYATPTCASCGIKMISRESKRGAFWGCRNYPRCKSSFAIKRRAD